MGILLGSIAMAVTVLVGVLNQGNVALISVYGVAAGLLFGIGGVLIGNLIHGYVIEAAIQEAEEGMMERELTRTASKEKAQAADSGEKPAK